MPRCPGFHFVLARRARSRALASTRQASHRRCRGSASAVLQSMQTPNFIRILSRVLYPIRLKLVRPGEPSYPQVPEFTRHLGGKRENAQDQCWLSASEKGGRRIAPAPVPGGTMLDRGNSKNSYLGPRAARAGRSAGCPGMISYNPSDSLSLRSITVVKLPPVLCASAVRAVTSAEERRKFTLTRLSIFLFSIPSIACTIARPTLYVKRFS